MSVELSKCKHGDKLRTRCGDIAEYIKLSGDSGSTPKTSRTIGTLLRYWR